MKRTATAASNKNRRCEIQSVDFPSFLSKNPFHFLQNRVRNYQYRASRADSRIAQFDSRRQSKHLLQICVWFRSYSETAAQILREINYLSAATQKIWSKFKLIEKSFHTLKKMASETRTFGEIEAKIAENIFKMNMNALILESRQQQFGLENILFFYFQEFKFHLWCWAIFTEAKESNWKLSDKKRNLGLRLSGVFRCESQQRIIKKMDCLNCFES